MKRLLRLALIAVLPLWALGCQNLGIDAPPLGANPISDANPVYIPQPPEKYGQIYETVLEILGDYGFEIAEPHRYSGRVDTLPRTSPGLLRLLKPGSPDLYDRTIATAQSYRHRVTVMIEPIDQAKGGGYFIEFIARKELEDVPRPVRSTAGGAVFRTENTLDRQTEVIDATFFEANWIYRGRDAALEQELIRRFKKSL